jgi:hypothetical protein
MGSDIDDATLRRGLAGYVRAVAAALGVPPEGTGFEISDTATAYLGLAVRWPERPGQDLMLVWSERSGWTLAVESNPPLELAHLDVEDLVPEPSVVAGFVADVLGGQIKTGARPGFAAGDRGTLAGRLIGYADRATRPLGVRQPR